MKTQTKLYLSRMQADTIMKADHEFYHSLFRKCASRVWSFGGVTFRGLPEDMIEKAQKLIE